jgi:transcriptional regulator with XRE-family HTH domain
MAQTLREIVGERILLLRRRKGLTQPELAQQTGMGISTLNRIEKGHQSMAMDKVVALVHVLGTTADYLLGLSDEPERGKEALSNVAAEPPKRPRPRKTAPVS